MQVEHVARIRFAAGRPAQYQRHLPVGHGLLGKVVIDDEGMASRIPEILSHGRTGKRCVILQGGRVGCRGGYDRGVVHGSLGTEGLDYRCDGGALLADGYIDAVYGIALQVLRTLVDYGVYGYRSLARLAVADYELPLAAADRNHRVDSLESGLQGLGHGLTEDDTGSLALQRHTDRLALYGAKTVKGRTDRVYHAAYQTFSGRYARYPAEPAHAHAFLDKVGRTKQDGTYIVGLKVHDHGLHAAVELEQLSGLGVDEAEDVGDTVADRKDLAYLFIFERTVYPLELVKEYLRYFARLDCIVRHWIFSKRFCCSVLQTACARSQAGCAHSRQAHTRCLSGR